MLQKDMSPGVYVYERPASALVLFPSATSLTPQVGLGPGNGYIYQILFSSSQDQAMKSKDVVCNTCFGLDSLEELFGLAQNSLNY